MKTTRLLLLFASTLFYFPAQAQLIQNGLIAYFDFDSNTTDQGPNKLKTISAAPSYTADRHGNPAGAFYSAANTVAFLDTLQLYQLAKKDSFSVSCWLKYDRDYSTGRVLRLESRYIQNEQYINFGEGKQNFLVWNHFTWIVFKDRTYEYLNGKLVRKYTPYVYGYTMKSMYAIVTDLLAAADDFYLFDRPLLMDEIWLLSQPTVTSVTKEVEENHLIYPNPAKDLLVIKDGYRLEVFTASGVPVVSSGTGTLSIAHLTPGLYLARYTIHSGAVLQQTFVKE